MADAFGDGSTGGGSNLKRVVATPAFLAVAALALVALGYLWWRSRHAGNAGAQTSNVVANPLTGPAEGPAVLGTADLTGIQEQLSNLTQQVSTSQTQSTTGTQPVAKETAVAQKNAYPGYGAAPMFSDTAGSTSNISGWIDAGQRVQLTGKTMQGAPAQAADHASLWWQLTNGQWMNADELGNFMTAGQ